MTVFSPPLSCNLHVRLHQRNLLLGVDQLTQISQVLERSHMVRVMLFPFPRTIVTFLRFPCSLLEVELYVSFVHAFTTGFKTRRKCHTDVAEVDRAKTRFISFKFPEEMRQIKLQSYKCFSSFGILSLNV